MNRVLHIPMRLDAAISYAERGWYVFPITQGTKGRDADGTSTHLLKNGHVGASNDPGVVRDWWTRWPDANIGVHLAASGLVAVDVDSYKADCGWSAFVHGREVPQTLVQRSPRGGLHYIFTAHSDDRFAGQLCAGVEIKHRGYILLEPSEFEGGHYCFETDDDPAPVPAWVPRKMPAGNSASQRSGMLRTGDFDRFGKPDCKAPVEEVEDLLSWIDPDAGGYDAWLEVLQALHDHFAGSAEGLRLAEDWSSQGDKFKPGEVASKWQGFQVGGGVTLSSIAKRARSAGADLSEIARRYRGRSEKNSLSKQRSEDSCDLSHDALALELGRRSWDSDARFVALWGKWLFWTGTHWQRDETLAHMSRTRSFLRERANEVRVWAENRAADLNAAGDRTEARKIQKWARDQARSLGSSATVAAVSGLARANPASATTHEVFDADRFLVGTPEGTVDLRTGDLRQAQREDLISHRLACAPADRGVRPELWLRFLGDIFEQDEETIGFLQRAAGYALTGSVQEHKLLFLHGSGRNGKSVFMNTLLDIWGDYGRRVAATTFLNSQTERHPTDIAGLHGARLAIASELPRGKTWDEAVIKDLTGGDRMTARFMRQDFFDFDPQMTLMIAGNTQPSFKGVDEAIRSRVVLVPFAVTIPPERRDGSLPNRLKAEHPAILRWCIDGALAWQKRGLDVPASIAAASAAYFDEEDTVGQFLQDETREDPGGFVASDDLIARFNFWCDRQGLGGWTKRSLIKELRQRGFEDQRSNRHRGLRGLRLK